MSFQCLHPGSWNGTPTRCNKCENCLKLRAWLWSTRIKFECAITHKIWFVTLTVRRTANYRHVQAWLKRVRSAAKHRGAKLRFFACEELGSQKGRKHWHVLLLLDKDLPRSQLSMRWKKGFEDWREVDGKRRTKNGAQRTGNGAARYSTKLSRYVAKGGKYRASQRFGLGDPKDYRHLQPIKQVTDLFPGARIVRASKNGVGHDKFETKQEWKARQLDLAPRQMTPAEVELNREIHEEVEATMADRPERELLSQIAQMAWTEGRDIRRAVRERQRALAERKKRTGCYVRPGTLINQIPDRGISPLRQDTGEDGGSASDPPF